MKTLEITEEGKITTIMGRAKSGKSTILKALINNNTEKTSFNDVYFTTEENKRDVVGKFTNPDVIIFEAKTFDDIFTSLQCIVLDNIDIRTISIDSIDTLVGDYEKFTQWLENFINDKDPNIRPKTVTNVYITKQMRRMD
jgi:energy-coupling factor transporter ATP-binding protein EcfA2